MFFKLRLELAEAEIGAALKIAAPQTLDVSTLRGRGWVCFPVYVCVCVFGYTASAVERISTPSPKVQAGALPTLFSSDGHESERWSHG